MAELPFQLTDVERRLFSFLESSLRQFGGLRGSVEALPHVVLRVAGGWVRDKLLGRASCDIDLVVAGIAAHAFLERANDYLESLGEERKAYSTVLADPEHGKHLTAYIVTLFDVSVDVLDLRGASALEDAQQRDLTINAMFYNINQGVVEDVTGGRAAWVALRQFRC